MSKWPKQKEQLESLIKSLEKYDPVQNKEDDLEPFLITWLKINKLCSVSLKMGVPTEDQPFVQQFYIKFNQSIKPQYLEYNKWLKTRPMQKLLDHFMNKLNAYFHIAEEFLKLIPIKSFEIYETAHYFVDFYQFVLNHSLIQLARNIIIQKIQVLKNAFEVEAGRKDLEKEEKQLSGALSGSNESKVDIPFANIDTAKNAESDLLISGLELPEEEYELPEADMEIKPNTEQLTERQKIPSSNYDSTEIHPNPTLKEPEYTMPERVFPYPTWFPQESWNQFATYRYCDSCGQVIHPETRQCISCHTQY